MSDRTHRGEYEVVIDPVKQRCSLVFRHEIDLAAVIKAGTHLIEHADFDPTYDALVDATAVDFSDRNGQVMRVAMGEIVSRGSPFVAPSRWAFVVSTALVRGYVGMFQSMRQDEGITRVFDSFEQADQWLSEGRADKTT